MAQNTPKRKIKDSVFTNLFQDRKYLLRLYKTLHPEDSDVTEAYAKDIDDNATHREARETAERMIKMGKFSFEDIALCVPSIPLDELKKLKADIMQLA